MGNVYPTFFLLFLHNPPFCKAHGSDQGLNLKIP